MEGLANLADHSSSDTAIERLYSASYSGWSRLHHRGRSVSRWSSSLEVGRSGCGLTQVIERRYEGLVAKDEASVYEGGPTTRWLKVKQKNWTVEEDRWRRRIFGPKDE